MSSSDDSWQDVIQQACDGYALPGMAVGFYTPAEGKQTFSFGYRGHRQKQKLQANDRFAFTSISKGISAACIGCVLEANNIPWDTPLKGFVPKLELGNTIANEQANWLDFLLHQAGIPAADPIWWRQPLDLQSALSVIG